MKIRDKLALIFRIFMKMLNEAHYFIIKSRKFNQRPNLFDRCVGWDLLGKIEQRLAWKEINVIRLAPVTVEELAHVRDVSH